MTLREKQAEFAVMVARLICRMDTANKTGFILEWYRTKERQAQLVAEKKSWTMNSKHIDGLAIDLCILKDGKPCWDIEEYRPLGEFWVRLGGVWGGSWKQVDAVHFEYKEAV
jgi:hypothetical protein